MENQLNHWIKTLKNQMNLKLNVKFFVRKIPILCHKKSELTVFLNDFDNFLSESFRLELIFGDKIFSWKFRSLFNCHII